MSSLISVVIPVYNQEKELEQVLLSIKNQTYKNLEIIIERDEKHEGAPTMRNRGLAKAKGEYIIFWDADVIATPEMLEKMKKVLDNNPKVSFVYCDYNLQLSIFNLQKIFKSKIFDLQTLKQNNYIHSTSLMHRVDAIKWDESLKRFQDWDLWLTMAEQGKVGLYIPKKLFTIIAKGSISSWLPSFAYKKPWKWFPGFKSKVKAYEEAKKIILAKHFLND